ncbi:MAG: hypothetical protein JWO81_3497, partial [Alphaproteobacteria bacterium]|nr:hypothetical protein [Alphaproteobacteria bacterium]
DLEIVRAWRFQVKERYVIFRNMAKYTVFLSNTDPAIAYGVVALSEPFEEVTRSELPVMVETVLLPFKGRIIYDVLLHRFNVLFGPGILRSLNESYKEAKARHGIVTTLPMPNEPKPLKLPKARPPQKPSVKGGQDNVLQVVLGLIDQFCNEHLNEEYAMLCRRMAEKLSRKRPSPLLKGSPNSWASGIVRAVGMVNFLHDKSLDPYMRTADIDRLLGTSQSSAAARMAEIKKMLGLRQFHHDWTLPSMMESNPLIWMLKVNGLMMDVRDGPRDLQEVAFNKGLIPYIPADRQQGK